MFVFYLFSKLITAASQFSLLSLFLSSYFVFVIDEGFEEALGKPTERTNSLPHIVAVLSVTREVK